MPVTTRKQLFELPDVIATRVTIIFYSDARDALLKALNEKSSLVNLQRERGRCGMEALPLRHRPHLIGDTFLEILRFDHFG